MDYGYYLINGIGIPSHKTSMLIADIFISSRSSDRSSQEVDKLSFKNELKISQMNKLNFMV